MNLPMTLAMAGAIREMEAFAAKLNKAATDLKELYAEQPLPAVEAEPVQVRKKPGRKPAAAAKAQPAKQRRKPAPPPAIPLVIAEERNGKPTCATEIRSLLQRRPMTSGELIKALPNFHAASIYLALGNMRESRQVESREDPADAQKKNYLVAA